MYAIRSYYEYLAIFNRIAGSADEMGSFIKKLKNQIKNEK